jgi:hypothetical protein
MRAPWYSIRKEKSLSWAYPEIEKDIPFTLVSICRYQSQQGFEMPLHCRGKCFENEFVFAVGWRDAFFKPYVGLKTHCSNHRKHAKFYLSHWLVTECADEKNLGEYVSHPLYKYWLKRRWWSGVPTEAISIIICSQQSLMPWSPNVRMRSLNSQSHAIRWRTLVNTATEYQIGTVRTCPVSRWYLLWKLLENVQNSEVSRFRVNLDAIGRIASHCFHIQNYSWRYWKNRTAPWIRPERSDNSVMHVYRSEFNRLTGKMQ